MTFRLLAALVIQTGVAVTAMAALKWEATEVALKLPWNAPAGLAHFAFVNEGPGAVHITQVSPGCGCTAALPGKTSFAPREHGVITVEFKPGHRVGTMRVPVSVQTDAQAEPTVLLLVATIEEAVTIDSRFVLWRKGAKRTDQSVRISIIEGLAAEFAEPEVVNPAFAARLQSSGSTGREFVLTVTPPTGDTEAFSSITLRARLGPAKLERVYMLVARTL